MAQVTLKGRELAQRIIERGNWENSPVTLNRIELQEVCSLICRHAVTHGRIQEIMCDGPELLVNSGWAVRRDAQIEARIVALAKSIGMTVVFGGDPRGYTVKLQGIGNNSWGNDGFGVN